MRVPASTALRALESVERELDVLYTRLAEVFSTDADLSALFFSLAKDERSHLILIQFQARLARGNPESFGSVDIDLGLVGELANQIVSFRTGNPNPTPEAALRAAIGFESHAAEQLHRGAALQAAPALEELIGKLGHDDSKHRDQLAAFLRGHAAG